MSRTQNIRGKWVIIPFELVDDAERRLDIRAEQGVIILPPNATPEQIDALVSAHFDEVDIDAAPGL